MYYNRILRVWVIDQLDYFLIGSIIGSFLAPRLKKYLSEKAADEWLAKFIIEKSGVIESKRILESKKSQIKKVYKLALNNRGGQLDNDDFGFDSSNFNFENTNVEKLAYKI